MVSWLNYRLTNVLKFSLVHTVWAPSPSSILRIWFSLDRRSDLAGAVVLIYPARRPVTMLAIVTSLVSPNW